jgi:glycosyltransferase involved in cell wall biosynthesis
MDNNFFVYNEIDKKTSGQRFFTTLKSNLAQYENINSDIILYNLSASIKQILYSRLSGKCIVLRVDGLYHDKINDNFLNKFNFFLKFLFKLMYLLKFKEERINFIANFLNENYKSFFRIVLSNHIIYQSNFSFLQHKQLNFNKKYSIILNASDFKKSISKRDKEVINLITIYDDWKPSKQLHILFYFMIWLEKKNIQNVYLTVLGYTGNYPFFITKEQKEKFENCKLIKFLPRFEQIDNDILKIYENMDIFVTFSFRDPCPNIVIESMSFGLPVIAINSGGIREIVKDAGILINIDDNESNIYSSSRFSNKFPPIKFLEVFNSIKLINNNMDFYKNLVLNRFNDELDITVASKKYLDYLRNINI